jgi:assimilatory nitrate reductase catalytic subunit
LFGDDELDDAARLAILAGRPAKPGLESGPIVCSCFSIGRSTLLRAIRTRELVSAEAIGTALRAGTNCGSCVPELNALLAEAAAATAGGASVDT